MLMYLRLYFVLNCGPLFFIQSCPLVLSLSLFRCEKFILFVVLGVYFQFWEWRHFDNVFLPHLSSY